MLFCEEDKKMKFKIGGREHGQSIHDVLKLYNYIQSLSDDTVVKIVKKDNIIVCFKEKNDISKE